MIVPTAVFRIDSPTALLVAQSVSPANIGIAHEQILHGSLIVQINLFKYERFSRDCFQAMQYAIRRI